MADNQKLDLLDDSFNFYYDKAIAAHNAGDLATARKMYGLAAKTLLEMADLCPAKLKEAKINRAMKLVELADSLPVAAPARPAPRSGNGGNGNAPSNGGETQEGEGKKWEAAKIPEIGFDDIAGLADVKRAITVRMINPIKYPEKYKLYGKKTGGGVLLYGPPGTGKTMIAKAIAHEVGATFYAVKASDIVSKWVGESEQNISSLFETAKKDKLAIIFVDELDSLFGARGTDVHNDRRVNEFLQNIDGFSGRAENLLLLGATNRPWAVDSAAMRSGRFSEKIYVPLPDAAAREYLVRRSLRDVPLGADVDPAALAAMLENYSGADIDEICDRAKVDPLARAIETDSVQELTMEDFRRAIAGFRPSVPRAEILRYEQYAGITSAPAATPAAEPVKEPAPAAPASPAKEPAPEKEEPELELSETEIRLLPDTPVRLEFFLSSRPSSVTVRILGRSYECTEHLHAWKSDPLRISEAGVYPVEFCGDGFSITREIRFTKGMTENDLI